MEIKDLMIGDWVMYRDEPIIVYEIDEYYETINTESDGYDGIIGVEISEVKPIPLTAEILEKNYKSKQLPDDPYGAFFFGGNDHIDIYIKEYTDDLWLVYIDEVGMEGLRKWRMYVSNVHEFQHVLKLCGINGEIEL